MNVKYLWRAREVASPHMPVPTIMISISSTSSIFYCLIWFNVSVDSVFDAEEEGIKKHVFRSNSIVNIVNTNWLKDFQVEPTSTSMHVDF